MSVRIHYPAQFSAAHSRAFTLIELLVVMVIIVIITSMVMLSFGILEGEQNLQREARRLTTIVELANDEAEIQGRDFGLEVMQNSYRFVEFDPFLNQWHEVIGDDVLKPRELEEGLEFELFIEERRVLLDVEAAETEREEDDTDLTDDYAPHILIMSSGDVSPFELTLLRASDRSELTINMTLAGELEIESNDQDPF